MHQWSNELLKEMQKSSKWSFYIFQLDNSEAPNKFIWGMLYYNWSNGRQRNLHHPTNHPLPHPFSRFVSHLLGLWWSVLIVGSFLPYRDWNKISLQRREVRVHVHLLRTLLFFRFSNAVFTAHPTSQQCIESSYHQQIFG